MMKHLMVSLCISAGLVASACGGLEETLGDGGATIADTGDAAGGGGDSDEGEGDVITDPSTVSCQSNSDCEGANIAIPDPCMLLSCDTEAGACALAAADDGAGCDDGNACTVGNVCTGGVCGAGGGIECEDDNPCTYNECDAEDGCIFPPHSETCIADGLAFIYA